MPPVPTSKYYDLHQLAGGVFAAVARVNSPVFSNAGIIDTGDHTLIFDTFNTHHAALDLRQAALSLTGRPGDFVIVSHAHSDHWMGNQVFTDHAEIIATHQANAVMLGEADQTRDLKHHPEKYEANCENTEVRLAEAQDPRLRAHLDWTIVIVRHQLQNLQSVKPATASQTYDGKVVFHGSKRTAELYTPGPGHTQSDAVLQLPDDRIAFIGDLGFFQTHPYLGDSLPAKWVATLELMADSQLETFVPGHGPVGTRGDLLALRAYILALDELASGIARSGGTEDIAASQPPPEFSKGWAGFGRFDGAMRFLFQQRVED
jgi:glyoxylase-like metal-dependent hydrolase (beta-lactamase superfamily II)